MHKVCAFVCGAVHSLIGQRVPGARVSGFARGEPVECPSRAQTCEVSASTLKDEMFSSVALGWLATQGREHASPLRSSPRASRVNSDPEAGTGAPRTRQTCIAGRRRAALPVSHGFRKPVPPPDFPESTHSCLIVSHWIQTHHITHQSGVLTCMLDAAFRLACNQLSVQAAWLTAAARAGGGAGGSFRPVGGGARLTPPGRSFQNS